MDSNETHKPLSLLLVDDDIELCTMMAEYFAAMGHRLDSVHDGREGLAMAIAGNYDLLILDVMLPVLDGFAVLEQLRRRKTIPVIMLTARVQSPDRVRGLNAGADDYLPKPFDPDELLARVRAVLRRSDAPPQREWEPLIIGSLRIDPNSRQVWSRNQLVELTAMEYDLLDMLIRSAGRVVSREQITAALFEREANPYDRFLDVHISHLRKKLAGGRALIRTVRGVGYTFTGVN